MKVVILPCGPVPPALLVRLSHSLLALGLRCEIGQGLAVPGSAFDPRRRQYEAGEVLRALNVGGQESVVAVTTVDLFVDGMNFVFGLAAVGGRAGLVSLHRLRSEDHDLLLDRLVKESLHELGHTWGLTHCENAGCVMRFSRTLMETDMKDRMFCTACLYALPFHLALPAK